MATSKKLPNPCCNLFWKSIWVNRIGGKEVDLCDESDCRLFKLEILNVEYEKKYFINPGIFFHLLTKCTKKIFN